ncbi:hypothetical protein M662_05625 [Bacillus sp. SB49]|uniref:hypothetical protein n=1 Tax=Bacillus sp. SB49 TaxID=1071080 RepID=UPI0012686F58|nr:hypothetical protein [Bacillus sp. SB49]QHT45991.1 hypothetical protein M662_05625 [Bacillus sp. SB49]
MERIDLEKAAMDGAVSEIEGMIMLENDRQKEKQKLQPELEFFTLLNPGFGQEARSSEEEGKANGKINSCSITE